MKTPCFNEVRLLRSRFRYRGVELLTTPLDDHQINWHISEKELFSCVWGCERFERFLLGRTFTLYTDHKNLESLFAGHYSNASGNAKLLRWVLRLQPFDFRAQYLEGKMNIPADFLSRGIARHQPRRSIEDSIVIALIDEDYISNIKPFYDLLPLDDSGNDVSDSIASRVLARHKRKRAQMEAQPVCDGSYDAFITREPLKRRRLNSDEPESNDAHAFCFPRHQARSLVTPC